MRIKLFSFDFIVEYSFFLILSFAVLLGADDISFLLLYSALHELGHIIALLCVGGRIERLTLSFYGLALRYHSDLSNLKELIVIAFGPVVNLVLWLLLGDDINLLLFALNVLPVFPLDGGRVIRILFPKASKPVSAVTLALLIVLSLYIVIFYNSFSLVLISCYLLVYSIYY